MFSVLAEHADGSIMNLARLTSKAMARSWISSWLFQYKDSDTPIDEWPMAVMIRNDMSSSKEVVWHRDWGRPQ